MVTGQFVPKKKGKIASRVTIICMIFSLFGLAANIFPTVMILIDWAMCRIRYYDVCYTMTIFNTSTTLGYEIPEFIMRKTSNSAGINDLLLLALLFLFLDNISAAATKSELQKFSDYGKLVLLFSATSGTISYIILIICVIWFQYMKEHQPFSLLFTCYKPKTAPEEEQRPEGETLLEGNDRRENKTGPLHPFNNNKDDREFNTKLEGGEPCRFFIFFAINLALVIGMIIVFCLGHYNTKQHIVPIGPTPTATTTQMKNYKIFEMTTVGTYFYSLFCTISSCFIFSKVMYGIQNKCDNLFTSDDKDKGTLDDRIEEDEDFVEKAIATQGPFEWWFFIHWVMYIISSFLSLSLLFEAIYEKIQASTIVRQAGIDFSRYELIFIALFAFSNSFFFLYPCIRAAGVTESRNKAIRDVSSIDISVPEQRAFANYLKEQNFGFRLNILCAHVKFDLNIAYISIFIGLLGVLIKVGTSI